MARKIVHSQVLATRKSRPTQRSKNVQHSCGKNEGLPSCVGVLDAGVRCGFSSIFLALSFFCSQTESTPVPAPVTQTVGRQIK